MPIHNKSTRLGDILVDRGVITRQQLREAIEIQQARQVLVEKGGREASTPPSPLGEILIELGFITRKQLVQNLGWQNRLRKATLVMSFVAPLLTTACGGGGGGTSPVGTHKTENNAVTSSLMATEQSSSQISLTPSSSSSQISLSPLPSSSSSSSSSEMISGPVLLAWTVPSVRENGDELIVEEIGGYEIRYKSDQDTDFTSVKIDGGYVNSYYFNYLEGHFQFEIAAYDTSGLYSRFVTITPLPD